MVTDDPLRIAAKYLRIARSADVSGRRTLAKAALAAKTTYLHGLDTHGVASHRLRGVGAHGAAVGVRYEVGVEADAAMIHATGPWQLVENDTSAIARIPKARGRRAKARKRLKMPDGRVVMTSHRGPTRGKHIWAETTPEAMTTAKKVFDVETLLALKRSAGL